MTWRELSDELSAEWKRFSPDRPEISREYFLTLRDSARYTEMAIMDWIENHNWGDPAKEVRQELFLRFDFAIRMAAKEGGDGNLPNPRWVTCHRMLIDAWHEHGLGELREKLQH